MMQPAPGRPDRTDRNDRLDRPRFRQDLVAETVDEHGARFIDVMDPESGNLFRFYEVEYSLACGMDGERDVAGIVRWAQEELGLTPSPQEVRNVIATLGDLGFIDGGAPAGELGVGVVVAASSRTPPPASVELGTAGGMPARSPPQPTPADVVLGAPGGATRRAAEPVEDVALGAPGRLPGRTTPAPAIPSSEVSIDLADHIAVRRSDVQEAVRASKVMSAVEVPSGFDAIEDKPTAKAAPASDRPELRPEARPEVRSGFERPEARSEPREVRVGKSPLTKQTGQGLKPPVELPRSVERPAPQVPEPAKQSSPVLIVLLVLILVAVAAFAVWKYVLETPVPSVESRVEPTAPTQPAPAPVPAPPPAPPPPVAKIAMEKPPTDDVKTTRAGVIETILADKTAVKTGDVVVRLVGDKPIEADLAGISQAAKRLREQLDAATKKRDAAQAAGNKQAEAAAQTEVDARQKALAAKQDQLASKTTDLDKFLLHAPSAGVFSPAVKLGQKITVNDVVATVQRAPTPIATFTVDDGKRYAANASVELTAGSGEQHVTCTVADVQATSIKVSCPADPTLSDGAEVTLHAPATVPSGTTSPPSEPPPAPPATGGPAAAESQTAPAPTPPSQEPPAPPPSSGSSTGSAPP
jgi:hypothetical protein